MTPAAMLPAANAIEEAMVATRRRLSPHFTIEEFDSRDGRRVPEEAIPSLIELCSRFLEPVRRMYGPVVIHSGYRSRAHNARVRGAPRSHHRYELHPTSPAADFSAEIGKPRAWAQLLEMKGAGGLGVYPGFVHVDARSGRARW